MPKQKLLESLPIAGYDVTIHFKSGEFVNLPHAQVRHENGIIHMGRIKQSNPGAYPIVFSTMELGVQGIRKITYRPMPEDSVLTLFV